MTGEWFFPARRVLNAARDLSAFLSTLAGSTGLLRDLRAAYEIDGKVVPTADLTEIAMNRLAAQRRARAERERSLSDEIEGALRLLQPIWERHPDFTLTQAEDHLLRYGLEAVA